VLSLPAKNGTTKLPAPPITSEQEETGDSIRVNHVRDGSPPLFQTITPCIRRKAANASNPPNDLENPSRQF
jgi:hypothetical protein